MIRLILLASIPLFVAVDAVGTLPIFISLTAEMPAQVKKRIMTQSMVTALCLALAFMFLGKALFAFLGITMADFMVAGGAVLFCIAILDILVPGKARRIPPQDVGIVPIGTPLIAGPAVLTTSLMLIGQYGVMATCIALVMNIVFAGLLFAVGGRIMSVLGEGGMKAGSKVMSLLLAAIAVMMIRKGIEQFIGQ